MRLLLRNMADMVSACQGKASQHIETHAFSLSFNISVKPTGEYACFPSRIDLEGTLAHVALKTPLAFGICLRQVSNAKRSRWRQRPCQLWNVQTLSKTPKRTNMFLLVTFKSRILSATHVGLKFTYGFEVGVQ